MQFMLHKMISLHRKNKQLINETHLHCVSNEAKCADGAFKKLVRVLFNPPKTGDRLEDEYQNIRQYGSVYPIRPRC